MSNKLAWEIRDQPSISILGYFMVKCDISPDQMRQILRPIVNETITTK